MALEDLVRSGYDAFNRGDVDALIALAHPQVEITPLVSGLTSTGPWRGHVAVRRLLADAQERWARFDVRCDEVVVSGDRAVALVHIATAAGEPAPVVSGDVAHVLEFEGGVVTSFVGYRDRDEALAAVRDR